MSVTIRMMAYAVALAATASLGPAHSAKGQHERAIQDYDQSIKLDPSDADNLLRA